MTDAFPSGLAAWRDTGRTADVFGREVFFHEVGPADAPVLVVVHGFPTCSLDFREALPVLSQRYRVVVHDHLGFGLSDKPAEFSYSLLEQADFALGLWRQLGIERAHLLAHDMGTSVTTEILARRERLGIDLDLASVTLCNGSVYIDMAQLTATQKLLRNPTLGPIVASRATRGFFGKRIRKIVGDPSTVSDTELDDQWAAMVYRDGKERVPAIIGYIGERSRFADRWHGALRRLDLPTHVLWGQRDPVAVKAIGDRLAEEIPGATITRIDGLGHFPMVEDPTGWSEAALRFIDGVDA